ncbi:hypothetical protein EF908_14370, partial [Streptomyces sp. WAC04770]
PWAVAAAEARRGRTTPSRRLSTRAVTAHPAQSARGYAAAMPVTFALLARPLGLAELDALLTRVRRRVTRVRTRTRTRS